MRISYSHSPLQSIVRERTKLKTRRQYYKALSCLVAFLGDPLFLYLTSVRSGGRVSQELKVIRDRSLARVLEERKVEAIKRTLAEARGE